MLLRKMKNLILAIFNCLIPANLAINLLNLSNTQVDILQDLSWKLKPTVINSFLTKNTDGGVENKTSIDGRLGPNFRVDESINRKELLAQAVAQSFSKHDYDTANRAKTYYERSKQINPKDEIAMKTRMFSLMYETVRDTDNKVKRAELIKEHYANNTIFEIGFLMGEATDKYNSVMEVAATVQRLYKEWKPLDHINAYEQISSHALQINTVVDMIRAKYNSEAKPEIVEPASRHHYKINTF